MGAGAPYKVIPLGILFASNFRMPLNGFCVWNGIGKAWIFITDFRIFRSFSLQTRSEMSFWLMTMRLLPFYAATTAVFLIIIFKDEVYNYFLPFCICKVAYTYVKFP